MRFCIVDAIQETTPEHPKREHSKEYLVIVDGKQAATASVTTTLASVYVPRQRKAVRVAAPKLVLAHTRPEWLAVAHTEIAWLALER